MSKLYIDQVKVPRKRVAEILRAARDLMNDGGRHWARGRLRRIRANGEVSYCSVGAIYAVTEDVQERAAALQALVERGIGTRPIPYEMRLPVTKSRQPHKDNVIAFNDSQPNGEEGWRKVDAAFRKAVRSLR